MKTDGYCQDVAGILSSNPTVCFGAVFLTIYIYFFVRLENIQMIQFNGFSCTIVISLRWLWVIKGNINHTDHTATTGNSKELRGSNGLGQTTSCLCRHWHSITVALRFTRLTVSLQLQRLFLQPSRRDWKVVVCYLTSALCILSRNWFASTTCHMEDLDIPFGICWIIRWIWRSNGQRILRARVSLQLVGHELSHMSCISFRFFQISYQLESTRLKAEWLMTHDSWLNDNND